MSGAKKNAPAAAPDTNGQVTEQYLSHIVSTIGDSALLMGLMQTRFSGGSVSAKFLEQLLQVFEDDALIMWVLDNYYKAPLPESFLVKFSNTFGDNALLRELMSKHFPYPVTERYLCYIIDCLEDPETLRYALENHYKGQKVSESFMQKYDEVLAEPQLRQFIVDNYV